MMNSGTMSEIKVHYIRYCTRNQENRYNLPLDISIAMCIPHYSQDISQSSSGSVAGLNLSRLPRRKTIGV